MRRLSLLAAVVIGLASPVTCVARANAQVSIPPTVGASQAELDAAKAMSMQANTKADAAATAAAQAKAAADTAAAAAAAACQPMPLIPPLEVAGGTTGSGQNCRLVNAADNRISRTGQFTVGANGAILCAGSATCNWDTALPAGFPSYPIFFTVQGASGAPGVKCKVTSTTNTGFTGATCVQSVASVSILGAAVEVSATTGTKVFALSLPATQASQ